VSQTPSDPRLPFINAAIDIRAVDTRRGMLEIGHDQDGRIRCGYNPVGSNTGRVSCSESPTGSGYNLQTIPNYTSKADAPGGLLGDRDLFLSDPGYWFFQCDLSGADGWTVAAYSAMLGDRNLLEDYLAGLKPANVLALILRGLATEGSTRDSLLALKKKVSKDDWDYFACKRVQHGCCVTQEHEVLTKDGWKGIQDVEDREEILVYQQETGNCWFEKPTHWTREFYSGPLCVFEGTAFSLRCTPNHRILLDDKGLKVRTAKECLTKKSGRIPYSGKFIGGYESVPSKLICAIHADGCLSSNGKNIQFHFKKERKIKRLRALLVGRAFHEYLCADGSTLFSVPITLDLARGGIRPGKQMLEWTGSAMQDYANEIENWDGCRQGQNIRFFSANADFLHWARTIIHMSGKGSVYQGTRMSGFGSVIHQASVNNRSFAWLNSMERKEEQASEMIFCPTVSTGFFFVRRNKHISITGNSYLEGGLTVSRNIFKDSEGKFYLSPAECEKLKEAFFSRYRGIRLWHDWVARRLRERPVLIAASGQVRQFFGRRDEILTKAVAFEPQANTTYATNLALLKLWTDPENHSIRGICQDNRAQTQTRDMQSNRRIYLRIEPLHQVHDAVCGQFRKEDTAWATAKIKSYFDNPLKIAGQSITIPFEGGFGPSWGNLKEGAI
jgi:hypothetical protein